MNTDTLAFENEEQRRRAVAWVVALSSAFPLEARRPIRLTSDEQQALLTSNVYQILYRSTATTRFTNPELLELLEHARSTHLEKQITGLMLLSEGQFVHAMEGPEQVVRALYGQIQQDARHHEVETVHEGPLPARRFSEWSMDFGFPAQPDAEQVPGMPPHMLPGLSTTSALLRLLLEAFIG